MENYYKLLGISKNSSIEEIQQAIALNKNNIDASLLAKIALELGSADNKDQYDNKIFNRVNDSTNKDNDINSIDENSDNKENKDNFNIEKNVDKEENIEKDININLDKNINSNFDLHQNDYILQIHCYGFLVLAIFSFFVSFFENPLLSSLTLLEGVSLLLSLTYLIFSIYVIVREYKLLPHIKMHRAFLFALVLVTPVYYAQRNSLTRTLKKETIATFIGFFINILSRTIF